MEFSHGEHQQPEINAQQLPSFEVMGEKDYESLLHHCGAACLAIEGSVLVGGAALRLWLKTQGYPVPVEEGGDIDLFVNGGPDDGGQTHIDHVHASYKLPDSTTVNVYLGDSDRLGFVATAMRMNGYRLAIATPEQLLRNRVGLIMRRYHEGTLDYRQPLYFALNRALVNSDSIVDYALAAGGTIRFGLTILQSVQKAQEALDTAQSEGRIGEKLIL